MKFDSILTREAGNADALILSHFVNLAYRGEFSKKGWTTEADLLGGQRTDGNGICEILKDLRNRILLFNSADGELLGCVFLKHTSKDKAYLGMLTVKPDLQGSGLGKFILNYAEQWARKTWKISVIEMSVIRQRSELIAWYERRGYHNTGMKEPFPYGDARFGEPKVQDLEFAVLEKNI